MDIYVEFLHDLDTEGVFDPREKKINPETQIPAKGLKRGLEIREREVVIFNSLY